MAAVVVCYMSGIRENLVLLSPKRDPFTARVTLDTFLNYGRPTMATMFAGLVTGGIPNADNTYYVGLLPLAMAAYALVTEKDGAFLGIICAFGMLFWLSLGGVFASAFYYLPGMVLFRHIALVFGLAGMLLLLAAGYGIDRLAGVMSGSEVAPPPRLGSRLAWLGLVAGLMLLDFRTCWRPNDGDVMFLHPAWKQFFAFRLLVYATAVLALLGAYTIRRRRKASALVPALLLGFPFMLDMGSFRAEVLLAMPTLGAEKPLPGVFEVAAIPYQTHRSQEPPAGLAQARIQVLTQPVEPLYDGHHTILYGFSGWDPYLPAYKTDFISSGVFEMLRARRQTNALAGKFAPFQR